MTLLGHKSGAQDRLLTPARLEHFCPGEHCAKACGPGTCTCAPCLPSCRFCQARRKPRPVFEQPVIFIPNRQLHLFGGPGRKSR